MFFSPTTALSSLGCSFVCALSPSAFGALQFRSRRARSEGSVFLFLPPLAIHPSPLSPLESALTKIGPITPLESALPKTQHLKPFRIRTYEKTGGVGPKC